MDSPDMNDEQQSELEPPTGADGGQEQRQSAFHSKHRTRDRSTGAWRLLTTVGGIPDKGRAGHHPALRGSAG